MSLAVGPDGAPNAWAPREVATPARLRGRNGDGFMDLIVHSAVNKTEIGVGDSKACLTGEALDGTPFESCDGVSIIGK